MLKKKSTRILLAILTILVLILAAFEVKTFLDSRNKPAQTKLTTRSIGPYIVNATQTDFQKQVEPNLKAALESGSGKKIVTEASKYFISDFFTLRDKVNFNNVGGMGFVFLDVQGQFKVNAIDSYYRDLAQFQEAYGKENLPLVTDVKVGEPVRAAKSGAPVSASSTLKVLLVFDVPVTWTYETNDTLSKMNVITKTTIRFVKASDNNWYVYELLSDKN